MTVNIFEPFKIGNLELRNRFVRSATWDGSADDSGAVTDQSVEIYKKLGEGGIGLIITAYSFVTPLGKANPRQYGIHSDEMIPGLKRLAGTVHENGGRIALQIVHSGANSRSLIAEGTELVVVSSLERIEAPHREMTEEDIEFFIAEYVAAIIRAREAGFDAVQLHGAHGYGMNQFLSPLYNRRTDRWGGSLGNRMRFHLEVITRARKAVGEDFPLFIKFAVRDDEDGGLENAEGLEVARRMEEAGLNAIEVSSGVGTSTRIIRRGDPEQAYMRDRAAIVKKAVSVPVMVVGGIRSPEMAQEIIESGDADLISMCRPYIREPGLLHRWQKGDTGPATCISCNKCFGVLARGELLACGEDLHQQRKAGRFA